MRIRHLSILLLLAVGCASQQEQASLVLPSKAQVEWQKMEMNMFCHFGPNTFSGREWGDGTEAEDMFNPTDMDCRQWAATAKAAGFKGIIITAKHHDGFCLWPNPVSKHTVAQSSWKDGQGDVLRELSEACKEYGLKFGVYISPWDRNDPHYGTDEYNEVFVQTLKSALTSYGPVYEQWFDGACGEGPNGKKQVYDWPLFNSTVFECQPNAVIFSDVGPGCRWVGNEYGQAGRTNWSTLNVNGNTPSGPKPSRESLNCGDEDGDSWVPAETDVSIRPGWFWKESENDKVKSVQKLLQIYYESVGRNSLLLLNVPPDTTGRIHPVDSTRLMEFRTALNEIFKENLKGKKNATFNRVVVTEDISKGQRVQEFAVEAKVDGEWKEIAHETTIGCKRIVLVPETQADAVRIKVLSAKAKPHVSLEGLYLDKIYIDTSDPEVGGEVKQAFEPMTLDLGEVKQVSGFIYTPIPKGLGGVVETYNLAVSEDGKVWKTVIDEAMFENIVNNPIGQTVGLESPVSARYIRLKPLRTSAVDTYGVLSLEAF